MKIQSNLIGRLPRRAQLEFKRLRYRHRIARGTFVPDEPEIAYISSVAGIGDWVIDVGANIGHYTCHLANCVGPSGRVFAFEPIADTFALLAANVSAYGLRNVTLLNVAVSTERGLRSMSVPNYEHVGLLNYYRAHLDPQGNHSVFCLPLDRLFPENKIGLVKIDAEGHDMEVLESMKQLILASKPILIVEASLDSPVANWLRNIGYRVNKIDSSSPNIVAEMG